MKIQKEIEINMDTLEYFGSYVEYIYIPELQDTIRLIINKGEKIPKRKNVCQIQAK